MLKKIAVITILALPASAEEKSFDEMLANTIALQKRLDELGGTVGAITKEEAETLERSKVKLTEYIDAWNAPHIAQYDGAVKIASGLAQCINMNAISATSVGGMLEMIQDGLNAQENMKPGLDGAYNFDPLGVKFRAADELKSSIADGAFPATCDGLEAEWEKSVSGAIDLVSFFKE